MMITPYLNFDGHCREAFEFYARVLGGTIEFLQTFGESPGCEGMPAQAKDAVMHVCMRIGGQRLMASDTPQGYFKPMQGMYVSLHIDDLDEARRTFEALLDSGQVQMPFEKTFWSPGFGMGVDRFGTPWMVNCAQAP